MMLNRRKFIAGSVLAGASLGACTANRQLLDPYLPSESLSGVIRIWGHGSFGGKHKFVETLNTSWQQRFQSFHPGVSFENRLHGTASAIGSLYCNVGDIALMGREIWEPEIAAFNEVLGYDPFGIDVMTGSNNFRNKGYAITVFVHKSNPILGLSLEQLDAIFSVERRRGLENIETWGDLGLDGKWKDSPISLYGFPISRGFADYFQRKVFQGSQIWKPRLKEFPDDKGSLGGETDGGQKMLHALAQDPFGIAYSGSLYSDNMTRAVPISIGGSAPYITQSYETVRTREYPLSRIITMYVNKTPQKDLSPILAEYLKFVLSHEGQEQIRFYGGGYIPLTSSLANIEKRKLG